MIFAIVDITVQFTVAKIDDITRFSGTENTFFRLLDLLGAVLIGIQLGKDIQCFRVGFRFHQFFTLSVKCLSHPLGCIFKITQALENGQRFVILHM